MADWFIISSNFRDCGWLQPKDSSRLATTRGCCTASTNSCTVSQPEPSSSASVKMRVSKATNLGQNDEQKSCKISGYLSALITWQGLQAALSAGHLQRPNSQPSGHFLWRLQEVCLDLFFDVEVDAYMLLIFFLTFSDLLHFCLMPSTQCLQCVANCEKNAAWNASHGLGQGIQEEVQQPCQISQKSTPWVSRINFITLHYFLLLYA